MLLATTTPGTAPAPAATSPVADDVTWPNIGVIRRGGPDAPPAADVVAQANLTFPKNFGAQGLIDVTAGTALQAFTTRDEAIRGARALADGRASIGVVLQADGTFTVNELTVPNIVSISPDWDRVKGVTLVMGPDPVIPRSIEDLRQLRELPAGNGQLQSVWTRSGNTRWDVFEGAFRVAFNHV